MSYEVIHKAIPTITKAGKRNKWADLVDAVKRLTPNTDECVFVPFTGSTAALNSVRGNFTKIFTQEGLKVVQIAMDGGVYIWNRSIEKKRGATGWHQPPSARAKISAAQHKRWNRVRSESKKALAANA